MPHHWTRIGTAEPVHGDETFVDDTGETYVIGKYSGNKSKQDIAAQYPGVTADDVKLLKKKNE